MENFSKCPTRVVFLAEDGVQDKLLNFGWANGKKNLKDYKSFFMNGTFKSFSSHFAQIYTIYDDVGSIKDETNIVPVVTYVTLLPCNI